MSLSVPSRPGEQTEPPHLRMSSIRSAPDADSIGVPDAGADVISVAEELRLTDLLV